MFFATNINIYIYIHLLTVSLEYFDGVRYQSKFNKNLKYFYSYRIVNIQSPSTVHQNSYLKKFFLNPMLNIDLYIYIYFLFSV